MKRIALFLSLFLLLWACGGSKQNTAWVIGRDPNWTSLHLGQLAVNTTAFSTAVVQQMAQEEKIPLQVIDTDWVQLYDGLEKGYFGGVFSSLPLNLITLSKYDFSEPLLLVGPVLVVRTSSSATSLDDLNRGIIGVNQFDNSVLIVQDYPAIIIRLYQNMAIALNDLVNGQLDGVLLPNLEANSLLSNQFSDELKIVTPPLDQEGIRVATLKGQNKELIEAFNKGLSKAKQSGRLNNLKKQFSLPY